MKKKLPTKEEIKAARELRKQGRALMVQANKVLHKVQYGHRRPIRRNISQKDVAFRTWLHDYSIIMPAVARSHEATYWTPVDLATHAARATDRMQHEITMRRPSKDETLTRRLPSRKIWFVWQSHFDELVHTMAASTNLDADAVINRAAELADAMLKVAEKRKKRA